MELMKGPTVKVYTRGSRTTSNGVPSQPPPSRRAHPSPLHSDDDLDTGTSSHAAVRIEDDLNWATKYLSVDRSSRTPTRNGTSSKTSTEDSFVKAQSPAPSKYGSLHSDDSGVSGSYRSIGRRSKSPSAFSEGNRGSASPRMHRFKVAERNGYLDRPNGSRTSMTSPSISRPVTRTYADLSFSEPATRTYIDLDLSRPVTRTHANVDRHPTPTGNQATAQVTSGHSSHLPPVSATRKRLRQVICRSRNDPGYFRYDQ